MYNSVLIGGFGSFLTPKKVKVRKFSVGVSENLGYGGKLVSISR